MPMNIGQDITIGITEAITIGSVVLVLIVLALVVVASARPRIKRLSAKQYNAEVYKRRLMLEELSYPVLHGIRIPLGSRRMVKLEHVVRLPASVLLVTAAPPDVAGRVRVGTTLGQWHYVAAGGKVNAMLNPLVELHPLIQAIRKRFPMIRLRMLTVFPRSAQFEGAVPKGCCLSDDMDTAIRSMAKEDGASSSILDEAWEPLAHVLRQLETRAAGSGREAS